MDRNVATKISPNRNGQTEMSRDWNRPDRNALRETARPYRPDRIGQTEKTRTAPNSVKRFTAKEFTRRAKIIYSGSWRLYFVAQKKRQSFMIPFYQGKCFCRPSVKPSTINAITTVRTAVFQYYEAKANLKPFL